MEFISEQSYSYIMNKYHNQQEPFDSHRRFIRNDRLFEGFDGMEPEAILSGILAQDAVLQDKPHPVRKANAFSFVLKNTKISCDPRDPFPAIHMIDRPINKTLVAAWCDEIMGRTIPHIEKLRAHMEKHGIATIWPDYDHSVPIWDRLFALGFPGILRESEAAREGHGSLTEAQEAFFEGIRVTYTAIGDFLLRLETQARKQGSAKMAEALAVLRLGPPKTFYQALLLDYLYFMLSEHIEGLQVRSLGHFDRLFYGFYKNDLACGVSEDEIRHDLACFFLQFTAIGNYWNQPVFLGGCKEDESTQVNPLSYLFLDVYDRMGIYNPKVQIRMAPGTPKDFICKALDMIRRGNNCIVFVSDSLVRKTLGNAGVSPEEARLCDIKGCYEYSVRGAMDTGMNMVNLMKPLEYALHRGCDAFTGSFAGLESPPVEEYTSFQALLEAYKAQLAHLIDRVIGVVNGFEPYLAYMNPQSMLSATYPTCLDRGLDALVGGAATNNSLISYGFLADLADSLAIIKKYVFDRKELTLRQLVRMLDADYRGYEAQRRKFLLDRDKYGNNKPLPDSLAKDIVDFLVSYMADKVTCPERGGKWIFGFHVARQSYDQAPGTAASPNGRHRGDELSKNLSASMGQNREGITAAILSATGMDSSRFQADAALDAGLLPASVKGEEGLEAMYALVRTYEKLGGAAIHFNVFDAETLRSAQREPEKYQDLQIRVCGWNVLFNDICKEEQDGFIRQAESLV